ncbi:RNA-binding protein [Fundicoccus sp. Sow4_H7]|uniref:YlmH family RNA-binding protein n=1 Tax=Fundicoccus sp. Sow4_H7 TaxID=3438784 RepID=UPI003F914328
MNETVYQHYRREEAAFIDQVFSWMQQVENRYTPYISNFLTPREALIVTQLVNTNEDIDLAFDGGYDDAERKRACLYPNYFEPTYDDFKVSALNLNFPVKFANITHGRILGTLISTGIERDRIGDIITDGERWHILVDQTMEDFLIQQVTKIGNVGVKLEPMDKGDLLTPIETWQTVTVISSSLRLDALISKVYNFSRQRAKDSIAAGLVKVNFVEMERGDALIGVQDIVSVRKFGRFWIQSVEGVTKKDNFRLLVNVLEI